MEETAQLKEVVLCDLEKNIDIKMLTQYLTVTKAIDAIARFTKSNDRFILEFRSQKDAEKFINERAFSHQIIKRKFNLYFAAFQEKNRTFQAYVLNGLEEATLRNAFDICSSYGLCRIILSYEGEKKSLKGTVHFDNEKRDKSKYSEIVSKLNEFQITLREVEEDSESFLCSIELINYDKIESAQLKESERRKLEESLAIFMLKISEKKIKNMQINAFLHRQTIPMLKAHFKYSTNDDTFQVFERLRVYLIDLAPDMRSRLFYYSKQSNSFRTLFTIGLQMPLEITQKQFQSTLLQDFRKINPNVTQILLKQCPGKIWTGKIYMRDEQSGKLLASEYTGKRAFIFKHYKDKNKILINIFQDKKAINQIRKYETNAERMLDHIRTTRERQKQMMPVVMHQNYAPRREGAPRRQQNQRFRQRQQKVNPIKPEKQMKFKAKEEQFPSLK